MVYENSQNNQGETNSSETIGIENIPSDEGIRDEKGRIKPGNTLNPGGRPRKKKLEDYFSEEEKEDLILRLKQEIKEGTRPTEMIKLVIEQIFGKPKQGLDVTSNGETIFQITPEIATKNGINDNSTRSPEENS